MSKKVGIVACSNGILKKQQSEIEMFLNMLRENGFDPVCSPYLYAINGVQSGTGEERAKALMEFYNRDDIEAVFDISGGDIANEILPYLDYEMIGKQQKISFWGYSDLTVVLNAIYTKCGQANVLYQVRHLTVEENKKLLPSFSSMIPHFSEWNETELFQGDYEFIQGNHLSGIVVGGNIRCFLKLAGTEYFPDMTDKVLLLEARSGGEAQMRSYMSQLKQLGVFDKISGVILGTFLQVEQEGAEYVMEKLVKELANEKISIIKTTQIGHRLDSKAIWIGKKIDISQKNKKTIVKFVQK